MRAGFRGCVRNLEVNEHRYHFPLAPLGDAVNGFDVGEFAAAPRARPAGAESRASRPQPPRA